MDNDPWSRQPPRECPACGSYCKRKPYWPQMRYRCLNPDCGGFFQFKPKPHSRESIMRGAEKRKKRA